MIRHHGWILTLTLVLAACGAGEQPSQSDAAASESAAPPRPQAAPQPSPAPATEPEAPAAASVPTVRRLYTVQVAAFLSADSARLWSERLSERGLPVWVTEAQVGGRSYHRLRVGAHPDLAEVRKLARRIGREYKWPVWVAPVENTTMVPADAVAETRALLGARASAAPAPTR